MKKDFNDNIKPGNIIILRNDIRCRIVVGGDQLYCYTLYEYDRIKKQSLNEQDFYETIYRLTKRLIEKECVDIFENKISPHFTNDTVELMCNKFQCAVMKDTESLSKNIAAVFVKTCFFMKS